MTITIFIITTRLKTLAKYHLKKEEWVVDKHGDKLLNTEIDFFMLQKVALFSFFKKKCFRESRLSSLDILKTRLAQIKHFLLNFSILPKFFNNSIWKKNHCNACNCFHIEQKQAHARVVGAMYKWVSVKGVLNTVSDWFKKWN